MPSGADSTPSIQALDRGLVILEAVARARHPVALAAIRDLLGVDHSTAFRLAKTLKRRGFLACLDGRKDYVLGPATWRLAHLYDWGAMLAPICHPYLEQLVRQIGETAHLAVREGCQALFVDHVTPNHLILVSGRTGESVPLHCTAHGKALLVDFEQCQLEALFSDAPLSGSTNKSISSIKRLADACAEIRATGFAIDNEEFHDGIRCVAVPIRGVGDAVIASIGISAFSTRFPEQRFTLAGKQVLEAAQAINSVLKKQAKTL